MQTSIIIPAFNEEMYLPITLDTLSKHKFWDEVIVVNDGSTDKTSMVTLPSGVTMVSHHKNFGKGQAIVTGISMSVGDTILFLDADLGETVYLAEKLIEPIIQGSADMVIAKFPPAGKAGGFGFVKKMAMHGIKHFTGEQLSEPLSGQRCLRRELTNEIMQRDVGFGFEVALTLDVLRAGYNVREIEIPFEHRQLGRSLRGFYHRGTEFAHILKTLWMKR